MVYLEAKVSEPTFKPEFVRLNPEARGILEQLRSQYIGSHTEYRRDGYDVLGGVSQFDAWMLRAGEKLHLMAVRRSVGERVRRKLEEKYQQRMEIHYTAGGVFVKSGVSQKNASTEAHFSFHPNGITFYGRRGREQTSAFASAYAIPQREAVGGRITVSQLTPVAIRF